jgi:hypothetical protein
MSSDRNNVANANYLGVGPAVINERDCWENCDREVPLGEKVHLVETVPGYAIEEWCRHCVDEVRQRV